MKGGKLAETRDETSLKEIIEIAKDSRKLSARNFWIGLEFDPTEKNFQWLSDQKEAKVTGKLWYNGHPSYDGSHVHLVAGDMLLNDVGEGEAYKPVCQRRKELGCAHGWKSPGSQSGFCYNFMEKECLDGCNWEEAGEVCADNDSYLAEGVDFDFMTNFAKLLKLDVNWRIGITYNHSADIFIRESDVAEVDLSNVLTKPESKTDEEELGWYPDIEFKYEYDYDEELHDLFEKTNHDAEDHNHGRSCLELAANEAWQVKEGKCHRRLSKDLNIQPLCQL